jgi:hypothetical protein
MTPPANGLTICARMAEPQACPFCLCSELSRLSAPAADLATYRCNRCFRRFYIADLLRRGAEPDPLSKPPFPTRRQRKGSIH